MHDHSRSPTAGANAADVIERAYAGAEQRGLLRREFERDACGLAFLVDRSNEPSHALVKGALNALSRMEHRGASGADPLTGDGAGVLLQIPHRLLRELLEPEYELPPVGEYGLGMLFAPGHEREAVEEAMAAALHSVGWRVLIWRDVPVEPSAIGDIARASMPDIQQVIAVPTDAAEVDPDDRNEGFERALFRARRHFETHMRDSGGYVCSLSTRTVVYKGLLMAPQIGGFYPDLRDARCESALAIVHQRFSTNTLPSWQRAQPMRMIAHNGEINTLRGNVNAMRAREGGLTGSPLAVSPLIEPGGSDSGALDNAIELLTRGGRSLLHSVAMTVPAAWQAHPPKSLEDEALQAFYQYHEAIMEPWDGPAALALTDGRVVAAAVDRNGLRPARFMVTKRGWVVMGSEAGLLDVPPEDVTLSDQLAPGQRMAVDLRTGRLWLDSDISESLAKRHPWAEWLRIGRREIAVDRDALSQMQAQAPVPEATELLALQQAFGYTQEDLRVLLAPMANSGKEPIGSMGNDAPLAVLSDRALPLFEYFKQLFAQVTNPPIDPLREKSVMSLRTILAPRQRLFLQGDRAAERVVVESPVLTPDQFDALCHLPAPWTFETLDTTVPVAADGSLDLDAAVEALVARAIEIAGSATRFLILSDRQVGPGRAFIPSLLATAAVHHGLIRAGQRGRVALLVDSAEPREVMHVALLVGYGATAVLPRLAYQTVARLALDGDLDTSDPIKAQLIYREAVDYGLRKVLSKMGISTIASYRGAQIFEAVGLHPDLVARHFTGTATRLSGIGLADLAHDVLTWHARAYGGALEWADELDQGGIYQWRRSGERHRYDPPSVALLQHAVRQHSQDLYDRYSKHVRGEDERHLTLRGLLEFAPGRTPVPLREVEPASEIVKRFKTGAMSYGSISAEAHETLAIAMNRLGGKSNTGEGGEDPARAVPLPNGDSRRSAIKQVASGRFGVTIGYLGSADEIQIKMAQGAKPGEGGQLPGHKVDATIARLRYSTPGVGLISPPPHHDIYSIEDLSQLIYDLRNANPAARISVKLVSETGVGTVAAGVAKAGADLILISGASGGTGASPLSSIRHAGLPWEMGLAETQQALVANGLRGWVRVETDGQLRTGHDVAIAAALGAEEFGFATAALVASGCILMRACHLNTCPVGIATQDPQLRERFEGKPEHFERMMLFIAEELRGILARLGARRLDELVGRTDWLRTRPTDHRKASQLDLSPLLHRVDAPAEVPLRFRRTPRDWLDESFDRRMLSLADDARRSGPQRIMQRVCNTDRTIGTQLSHALLGAPKDATVHLHLTGVAGQSVGAFAGPNLSIRLVGQANDYLAKGLSGGCVVVVPPDCQADAMAPDGSAALRIGNVALYGATGGELFVRGRAGERFAVRNSGATAVVEGAGDHACEYMTGGHVVVLGAVGWNFAAGMSGGIASVYDPEQRLPHRLNPEMVELEPLDVDASAALRALLVRFVEETASPLAWRIVSGWETEAHHFVRVMPTEYRRALARQRDRLPA